MDKKRIVIIIIFIIIFIIALITSLIYYNGKYSVYFETGTNDVFLTKYVKKNDKVKEPTNPEKDGYVFKEWQLNGKKYDFDSKVKSNTILTAKWVKEEYVTIKFDTDSSYKIDPQKILKGESIKDLPISYKNNFEFIGWYLNNELYDNEEIYDDITLKAYYKSNIPTYEIGDKVKIIGSYTDSAYSLKEKYDRAIGWEREILDIIDNVEFPYMVGNEEGITGFFKSSSIEKKEG